MVKDKNEKYYSLDRILKAEAEYNLIIGERSNGKTYAALKHGIKKHVNSGYHEQTAIIRRWKEDLKVRRAQSMFDAIVENGEIERMTGGKFSNVVYTTGRWYLSNYDDELEKHITAPEPFAFSFALSDMEHDKSTSYPKIKTIVFDEFLTRRYYLPDEFILFINTLSTIIRQRGDVKIFMLGNTVNKYSPYFKEMGLTNVKNMEQGTIDVYEFGKLKIAVEYADNTSKKKKSNKYFAFNDSAGVNMVINGAWELDIYPHLKTSFNKSDILFIYFIEFNDRLLQCEIVQTDTELFTYIHEKTTPIQNPETDIIYSLKHHEQANYRRRLLSKATKMDKKIAMFYAQEKVFFQNNEIGDVVRNYIQQSTKSQYS